MGADEQALTSSEGTAPDAHGAAQDVFVSYASADVRIANQFVEHLERAGASCWIAPRNVIPGVQYAEEIIRGINEAKVLVLVLSSNSVKSAHVGKEVERASSKRRPIIAIRTDAAPLPPALEYFLSESQWVEVGAGGIESAAAKAVAAIRRQAGATQANRSPSPASVSVATPSYSRRWVMLVVAVSAIVVAVGGLLASRLWVAKPAPSAATTAASSTLSSPASVAVSDKSIAVLPFVDMSEKKDQEYFSDGLSEELIDHLAHVPDLKVIARTSSFAFKGRNEDMRTIASKLGVASLLEGSVRKAGGQLRITAQLIRASDGGHLWSETYDRKLDDIFKVQEEISTTVAKALDAALNVTSVVNSRPTTRGTSNIAAYNLLLKGNYFFYRSEPGDNQKAVDSYQRAISIDPHYALAWAKLARTHAYQGYNGDMQPHEAMIKGREAAEQAIKLDPNCAEAYYARGNVFRFLVGDWQAAKADFEKAVALDPNDRIADDARGNILLLGAETGGNFDGYIDWQRKRANSSPLDTLFLEDLAWFQYLSGRLEGAADAYRQLLALNARHGTANAELGIVLLLQGKHSEALSEASKESDGPFKQATLACIYWAEGQTGKSDFMLNALERENPDRFKYLIASVHAYRGEADAAFSWLERSYRESPGSLETDLLAFLGPSVA